MNFKSTEGKMVEVSAIKEALTLWAKDKKEDMKFAASDIASYIETLLARVPATNENVMSWIPCNKALPTVSGRYLISLDKDCEGVCVVEVGEVEVSDDEIFWYDESMCLINPEETPIMAWMKLPEPYAEKKER